MTTPTGLREWEPQPLPAPGNQSALFGEQEALFEGHAYYVAGTEWPYLSPELLGDDDAYELLSTLDQHRTSPRPPEVAS